MTYNGTQMSYQNPGLMSPSGLNPAAAAYASQLQGLGQQIQGATPGSAYYQGMANTQGAAIQSSIGNQMAGMGLSGSSAAAGAMTQAGIQNNQAWTQKQFQDTMASAQAQGQLNQAGYGQTMGIQNQYGEFEDAYNQSIANLLGAQQQSSEAETSAWTGGISALLGGGGTAAGGIFHGAGA